MGASVAGLGAAATNAAKSQSNQNNFDNSWLTSQYQNLLGRAPDAEGYNYWNQQLQNGMSQQDITNAFMQSPEYMNRANQAPAPTPAPTPAQTPVTQNQPTANNQQTSFVNSLYKQYLGRDADAGGLEYWSNQLAGGASPSAIIEGIKGSPEYGTYQAMKQEQINQTRDKMFNPFGNNPFATSGNPYIQAAQQTSAGNLANAQAATAANRVNQSTPFGSVNFQQTGVDAAGNPIWSANQQLAPGLQPAFNNIQQNVAQQTARPFDVSATQQQIANIQSPEFERIGQRPDLIRDVEGTGMEGWDRANELMMSRLAPRMQQLDEALDAKLANRGIMPGTEAYNRAKLTLNQANNDLTVQAQLAGAQLQNQQFQQNLARARFGNEALTGQNTMGLANAAFNNQVGQQGFANQMANLQAGNQARQSNFQQNLAAYNNPLQQLAAFREGTNPAFVNYYNQPNVAGPDYFGAYTTSTAADIAAQNAANARTANMQSGLFGLGSAALLGGGGVGGLFNLGKSAIEGIGQGYDWLSGQFGGGGNVVSNIPSVTPSDYSRWFSGSDVLDDLIF